MILLATDLCRFCGGHWLDYRSARGGRCYAIHPVDLVAFHATPYRAHRWKGIMTGEPLGIADYVARLLSEPTKVGV